MSARENTNNDIEAGVGVEERDCRICHLNLVGDDQQESIELGCACKGDLGAAHNHCAQTWFKLKGNTTCEICGTTAINVAGEQTNETDEANTAEAEASAARSVLSETRNLWRGRRILNFLLGCVIFAFVISWLFHFNILP